MKVPDGMRIVFQGKADFLKEIADRLVAIDIKVATGPAQSTAWEQRAWLAVASDDIPRAMAEHQKHLDQMVTREGLPLRDDHADLDADETTCPACMTPFKTKGVSRCPECGLNFG